MSRRSSSPSRCAAGALLAALALSTIACEEQGEPRTADSVDPCSPAGKAEHAAETAGSAVETGATTAWEGMKTFGQSVGGLFEGGEEEAKKKWDEGADKTRKKAREGAADTKQTANAEPCVER